MTIARDGKDGRRRRCLYVTIPTSFLFDDASWLAILFGLGPRVRIGGFTADIFPGLCCRQLGEMSGPSQLASPMSYKMTYKHSRTQTDIIMAGKKAFALAGFALDEVKRVHSVPVAPPWWSDVSPAYMHIWRHAKEYVQPVLVPLNRIDTLFPECQLLGFFLAKGSAI